ncbi:MAG: GHKL domain-containing protein [Muribaculaceae bacterium]|nr:GHKL domain-containing protein [Roseburia sp.]MCM1431894.1 GHKL domain-containing protein [Muribaculaceae bacterium]MCM1493454.1 GHKL domain-containing protein [Muribaculaceae bacterium]
MDFIWIRTICIYWIAINLYTHFLNISAKRTLLSRITVVTLLSIVSNAVYFLTGISAYILSLLLFFLLLLYFYHNPVKVTLTIGMLAYGISYVLYGVGSLFVGAWLAVSGLALQETTPKYLYMLIGLISIAMGEGIFKIRRLRKGLKLDSQGSVFIVCLVLGILLNLCILAGTHWRSISYVKRGIILFLLFALGFLFFAIWQSLITSYYRKRLRRMELESLRQELAEKEAYIRKLEENNDGLAHIIHRDNKLIPAMETSVQAFLQSVVEPPEEVKAHGRALSGQLEELAKGRRGILAAYESSRESVAQTGHVGLDGVLSYMHGRAAEKKICCEVKVGTGFAEAVPARIGETDCSHLLSDLIENAIIAIGDSEKRAILIHLGVLTHFPVIEVSDSGAPFDPAVYKEFGLERHSTHLHEGGSGIGLLDIWEIKKKYRASLHIHEFSPEGKPYTKKLALVFDGKGHFLIRSYRNAELAMQNVRSDLYILPSD